MTPIVRGRLALAFGADAVLRLAVTGWFGCIPLLAWGASLATAFRLDGAAGWGAPLVAGIGILAALVVPAVVPVLVLRARDPASHIEWDEHEVREHRGALVRCAIPLARASAALLAFTIAGRRAARTARALQVVDDVSGDAITAWEHAPPGTAAVRRRLCVESVEPLRAALVDRGVPFQRELDLARAGEADRVRSGARTTAGRLGYALATLAVLIAPSQRAAGIALGAVAAGLLALRAVTSLRELRAVLGDPARDGAAPPSGVAAGRGAPTVDPPAGGAPYRTAPAAAAPQLGQLKRGAVIAEVAVRLLLVLLAVGCPLIVSG